MRYNGSLRLLATMTSWPEPEASDEALPEIVPGAFAAWAQAARDRQALRADVGAACVTPDGRAGWVTEILDGGDRILVCQPA